MLRRRGRLIAHDGRRSWLRRPFGVLTMGLLACLTGLGFVTGVVPISASAAHSAPHVLEEVPVTPTNRGIGPANNSPFLVVDPNEPSFVVMPNRLDGPDFGCALQISGDGGRSWLSADPVPKLPPGAEKCYAPEAAFDQAGVLYYLFVGLVTPGNEPMGAFLTTSVDRGRTFTPPRQVLGPLNFGIRMAIDPTVGEKGRIHLVWLHATSDPPLGGFGPPPNPILAAHSDDGGATFSTPVQINPPDRARVVAPALGLGPDGAVHVAYYDLSEDVRDYSGLEGPRWEGEWSLLLARSADMGKTFGPSVVVDHAIVPSERVMLIFTMPPAALAAGRDQICLAWQDARYGDADVLLRCSRDQGVTWKESKRVNDDAVGNGRSQELPQVAVAPGGRIDAVFLDRRNDPQDLMNEVFYTYSTDGGVSFMANVLLTQKPSDSQIGQEYVNVSAQGQVEFGSRLALLSTNARALAAWPDTRNSIPITTGQDIFATAVTFPELGGTSLAVRLLGAVLLAGGVLVLAVLAIRRTRRSPS